MTVTEAVNLHVRINPQLRPNTVSSYRLAVDHLTGSRALLMRDMTPDFVRTAYDRMNGSHSAATANLMLRSVKAIWNSWADEFEIDGRNPTNVITAKRGRMFKVKPREGAIPPDMSRIWLEHVVAQAVRMGPTGTGYGGLAMLFLAGLRLNEALGLRWSEIDGDVLTIAGKRMKAGEDLTRPITSGMRAILDRQAMYHGTDNWVFPARRGDGHMADVRVIGRQFVVG